MEYFLKPDRCFYTMSSRRIWSRECGDGAAGTGGGGATALAATSRAVRRLLFLLRAVPLQLVPTLTPPSVLTATTPSLRAAHSHW